MATKIKKKYPKLAFIVSQFPGCCGIGVIEHFYDEEDAYNWFSNKRIQAKKLYATREEQAAACYDEILEKTWENPYGENYSYLQIALVSNYAAGKKVGTAQCPELQQLLIDKGWTINMVFINPNHGNEVTVFSKYFPERDKNPEYEDEFEEEWEE